jgi:hypothetical protein
VDALLRFDMCVCPLLNFYWCCVSGVLRPTKAAALSEERGWQLDWNGVFTNTACSKTCRTIDPDNCLWCVVVDPPSLFHVLALGSRSNAHAVGFLRHFVHLP